jgi:propanediol dehydratase small subunit
MRLLKNSAILLALGLVSYLTVGCATDKPGATYTLGTYSVMVNGTPDKVTTAAYKAATDLKLSNVDSGNGGTKVDGRVTAQTAQNDQVTIDISQAGENTSKVSIRVGTTGDQNLSSQLVDKINSHLSWL